MIGQLKLRLDDRVGPAVAARSGGARDWTALDWRSDEEPGWGWSRRFWDPAATHGLAGPVCARCAWQIGKCWDPFSAVFFCATGLHSRDTPFGPRAVALGLR